MKRANKPGGPARSVPVDEVLVVVIDDGSIDRTVDVARKHGVGHILSLGKRCGLARAFTAGMAKGLSLGADVIVNTDADNQYCGADIPKLVEPILRGQADLVVGARPIGDIKHFSPLKKMLQFAGSAILRQLSQTPSAPSGFAPTLERPRCVNVFSQFTYTMDSQSGGSGASGGERAIRVNARCGNPPFLWDGDLCPTFRRHDAADLCPVRRSGSSSSLALRSSSRAWA